MKPAFLQTSHQGTHSDRDGSFEVFWVGHNSPMEDDQGCQMQDGWYWWSCSPGCLPDGDHQGPFDTSQEAWQDAKAGDY